MANLATVTRVATLRREGWRLWWGCLLWILLVVVDSELLCEICSAGRFRASALHNVFKLYPIQRFILLFTALRLLPARDACTLGATKRMEWQDMEILKDINTLSSCWRD